MNTQMRSLKNNPLNPELRDLTTESTSDHIIFQEARYPGEMTSLNFFIKSEWRLS